MPGVMLSLSPVFCFGELTWDTRKIELTAPAGDKEVVGVFHFVNSGSAPITITSVQPSCGCTTAELAKSTYAPGEKGEIKAIFTFGDRLGLQEKIIHVTTDQAPDKPEPLVLRVTIPELFTYAPRMLMWQANETPNEKETVVSVLEPHKITGIEVKAVIPAEATTRLEPVAGGTKYRLLVRPNTTGKAITVSVSCVVTLADGTICPFSIFALVR